MRKLLLVGDPPSTGGTSLPHGIPYVGRANGIDHAIIGGQVFCDVCNSMGFIGKAGGPSRRKGNNREIALEGDILLCRCPVPPIMVSGSEISWLPKHDDQIESLGKYIEYDPPRDDAIAILADKFRKVDIEQQEATWRGFDEQIRVAGTLPENYPYFIETVDGYAQSGRIDGSGHLPRIRTNVLENYTIYWGDEALAKQFEV